MNDQLETEQYLIGNLMAYPDKIYQCEIMPEQMIYLGGYLEAISRQYYAAGKIDFITIADDVVRANPRLELGEVRQNFLVLSGMAISSDISGYVQWLKNSYQVRQLGDIIKSANNKLLGESPDSADIYSILKLASEDYEEKSLLQTQTEVVDHWIKDQEKVNFTPTGFRHLDNAMDGGLYDGNVYGLAGYAKAGKTLLAGTISGNLAQRQVKHLYVAMEMGAGAIEARNLARKLHMKGGYLRREIKQGRNPIKVEHLHDYTVYANCPGITWEELKQQILIAIHKHKVKGLIIDYWQLISNPNPRYDNHQYWSDVAQDISNLCKKHNVWCILVAQLNDDGKTLGSRGLVRACDMLLKLGIVKGNMDQRFLAMDATRYTIQQDLGTEVIPYLQIMEEGPYMAELDLI